MDETIASATTTTTMEASQILEFMKGTPLEAAFEGYVIIMVQFLANKDGKWWRPCNTKGSCNQSVLAHGGGVYGVADNDIQRLHHTIVHPCSNFQTSSAAIEGDIWSQLGNDQNPFVMSTRGVKMHW